MYTIRPMTRQEVSIAVDWAASEGWNPGLFDAISFHAADPHGFLVGLLDDAPVATISVVRYGDSFGFLGFYIVRPEHRGKGYGMQIWNAGLARLEGRSVGLDGVIAQQDNYRRSGFEFAHNNIRYEGVGGANAAPDADIVHLSMRRFDEIRAYDQPFFADDRAAFLKAWIEQPQSTALGILRNHALAGYGVLRPCRSGFKIGPLFADNVELAERLFAALTACATPGSAIFLDAPAVNAAAIDLAQRHQMAATFQTARMYKGLCPELPLNRSYGITSFELG